MRRPQGGSCSFGQPACRVVRRRGRPCGGRAFRADGCCCSWSVASVGQMPLGGSDSTVPFERARQRASRSVLPYVAIKGEARPNRSQLRFETGGRAIVREGAPFESTAWPLARVRAGCGLVGRIAIRGRSGRRYGRRWHRAAACMPHRGHSVGAVCGPTAACGRGPFHKRGYRTFRQDTLVAVAVRAARISWLRGTRRAACS